MTTIAPVRRRWSWASIKNAGFVQRLPVWVWRLLMHTVSRSERARFNVDPITAVDYRLDIDFVGDGIRAHRLDVISPLPEAIGRTPSEHGTPLPVYVYFHGGGWTSGDKATLTKYCASQAAAGMVVVNANYRKATSFRMSHMIEDADAALEWVRDNISAYGGDPSRIVLGGDSAGGQIAAIYSAAVTHPELAAHYSLSPSLPRANLRGLVQHCSAVDFSVIFDRGFILSRSFIRILLPQNGRGLSLRRASRYLSPIEWVGVGYPPVFLSTSERDYFYRANLNFLDRLRHHRVHVETVIYERGVRNTEHTWQQDASYPESQEVYRALQEFVARVTQSSRSAPAEG